MSSHAEVSTNYGQGKKSLSSYLLGLGLSLGFTFFAFWMVSNHHFFAMKTIYVTLSLLAVLQLIAQVVFFLRINTSAEGKWNLMPFFFTLVIILVLVAGSLWIMYNLNYNMVH